MRTWLLIVTLVAACKETPMGQGSAAGSANAGSAETGSAPRAGSSNAGSAETGSAASNPQPDLRVTLDGKPVVIQSVLAIPEDDGEIEVRIANFPLTCKQVHERFRPTFDNEVAQTLRIGKQLKPDGTYQWSIRGKYFDSTSTESQDKGDALPGVSLDASAGAKSELVVSYVHETLGSGGSPKKVLAVQGKADVLGCGPMPSPIAEAPQPEAQPEAFITVAGQNFPIVGAAFIAADELELALGTSEVKCVEGSRHTSSRSEVEISLSWDTAGRSLRREVLDGPLTGWVARQVDPMGLTATPSRPRAGAKEYVVTLGGSTKIGDFEVALTGKVRAIVCIAAK
jgi:hypothetical protein